MTSKHHETLVVDIKYTYDNLKLRKDSGNGDINHGSMHIDKKGKFQDGKEMANQEELCLTGKARLSM